MRILYFLLLSAFSLSFSITAYVIEKEEITRGMMERKVKVTRYVAKGYEKEVRVSNMPVMAPGISKPGIEKTETIKVFKRGKVITYDVNHLRKMYTKMEMPASLILWGIMSVFYDCDQQGNCRPKSGLKVTNEFRKIGRWKARKVITTTSTPMGEARTILWVAKDRLLQEAELKSLENALSSAEGDPKISSSPSMKKLLKDAVRRVREFIKKHGATVMSESEGMMGMKVVEVVKSVSKKNVPQDFFSPPKGYQQFKLPMGGYRPR